MDNRDAGTQHKLRMPPELKERLFASAKEMNRSLNSEIVARLEKSFEAEDTPEDLRKIIKEENNNLQKAILTALNLGGLTILKKNN